MEEKSEFIYAVRLRCRTRSNHEIGFQVTGHSENHAKKKAITHVITDFDSNTKANDWEFTRCEIVRQLRLF